MLKFCPNVDQRIVIPILKFKNIWFFHDSLSFICSYLVLIIFFKLLVFSELVTYQNNILTCDFRGLVFTNCYNYRSFGSLMHEVAATIVSLITPGDQIALIGQTNVL